MLRAGLLCICFLFVALAVSAACAQSSTWPSVALSPDANDPHGFVRGPGSYLSITKLILCIVIYLTWVKTTDWVSQDCQIVGMPYAVWNPVVCFSFVAAFFLFALTVPLFFVGYFLLLLSYGGSLGAYIYLRNQKVPAHQRVMTPEHLRHFAAGLVNRAGGKMATEKKAAHEKGPNINLVPKGGATDGVNQSNLITARQSPGFVTAKEIMYDALRKRSEKISLDYTAEAVGVKYFIDGLWLDMPSYERDTGDPILAVFKKLANLNPDDRRNRQHGNFAADYKKQEYACTLTCQGTPTGEKAVIEFATKSVKFDALESLGMREKMRDQLKELVRREKGLILISSLPSGGVTTTSTLLLRNCDRFMRDFVGAEAANARDPEVENVEMVTYDATQGESPATVLPKLLRKQPGVVVLRDLVNLDTLNLVLHHVNRDERMAIVNVRAKEAVEALLRVLALKCEAAELAQAALAVLNQRLVRKLCEQCKVGYEPTPELLQKLGIPPGRVQAFFREPQPNDYADQKQPPPPCEECGGVGYRGRTSIFELLVVSDKLRQALQQQPKVEVLRQVARQGMHPSLLEEGLVLVAKGVTSLSELQRVLKQ